jgi:hypothetical protein
LNQPETASEPNVSVAAAESKLPDAVAAETTPAEPAPEVKQTVAPGTGPETGVPPEGAVVEKPLETAPNPPTVTT